MKIVIISILLILLILVVQGMISISTAKTESQKYRVLLKEGKFEIREYAPAVLATVKMDRDTYRETSSGGFRVLAGYIFGNNERGQKIAMTSPVRMKLAENETEMSFVMPSKFDKDDLPAPVNPNIDMHRTEVEVTASLKFGGWANDKVIQQKIKELEQILMEKGIQHTGEFTYLGYNPPYQAVNRRNEVIVTLVNYPD